jgi:hypothetical protein
LVSALGEEHTLRVFENRMLREYLELQERRWQEGGEHCIMRNLITCRL